MKRIILIALLTCLAAAPLAARPARAADKKAPAPKPSAPAAPTDAGGAERVNVDTIKEKYWARGDENEMGVVQNRLYSKERRFELGLGLGVADSDPFLSVKTMDLSLGYHFSEYISLHAMYFRYWTGTSTAYSFLLAKGGQYNTNLLDGFYGGELRASLIYGKLSVVGKAIIHYDMHVSGGAGVTKSETGSYFTPSIGIGQKFYLGRNLSLNFDYRTHRFVENEVEKTITPKLGQVVQQRTKYNNIITLGVSWFFGGPAQ
jgi:outer membrane beta-barrel protein